MRKKNERFSSKDISLIRKLTEEGKSLGHLAKLFSVGKSTIYYQVRKFKPRIKKEFSVKLDDFQIGELIGAFAGDGCYSHSPYDSAFPNKSTKHTIRYFLTFSKEEKYAEHLVNLLKKLNLNPYVMYREQSVIIVTVNSKEYIEFIKKYLAWDGDRSFTVRLRKNIHNYSDEFLRGFARGLMDTDGFLNPGNAVCGCISERLIENLSQIFEKFNLNITKRTLDREGKRRPLHYLRVRRKSLSDYNSLIGFSNSHKIESINKILSP